MNPFWWLCNIHSSRYTTFYLLPRSHCWRATFLGFHWISGLLFFTVYVFVYLVTTGESHVHRPRKWEWRRGQNRWNPMTSGSFRFGKGHLTTNKWTQRVSEVVSAPEKTLQGRRQSVPRGSRWRGSCVGSWAWAQRSACAPTWWPWPTSSADLGGPCPFPFDAGPPPSSFPTSVRLESGEFDLRLFLSCENLSEAELTSALCLFSHLLSKQHNYSNPGDWAETKTPQGETSPSLRTPNSASSEMASQTGLFTASKPGSQVARVVDGPPQPLSTHQRTPGLHEEGISTSTASRPPQASDRRHHSPSTRQPGRGSQLPGLGLPHTQQQPSPWNTTCLGNRVSFNISLKSPKNKHVGTLKAPSIW